MSAGLFSLSGSLWRLTAASSPAVLGKKVVAAAHVSSFSIGSLLLKKLGDVQITGRGLNKTATRIGTEMVLQGKADLAAYFSQPLPREHTKPTMPISLACVSVDGGRMQTRTEALGLAVPAPPSSLSPFLHPEVRDVQDEVELARRNRID